MNELGINLTSKSSVETKNLGDLKINCITLRISPIGRKNIKPQQERPVISVISKISAP